MKPILFSTPMVQAILSGNKSVTRRVINPQPQEGSKYYGINIYGQAIVYNPHKIDDDTDLGLRNTKYSVGDILWVRETWKKMFGEYCYKADNDPDENGVKWRPSIFMPREAARIFLRVTNVRVERLQDITEEQAVKEGCDGDPYGVGCIANAHDNFANLWNSINSKRGYGWDTNPWVWVIEFERCEKPL